MTRLEGGRRSARLAIACLAIALVLGASGCALQRTAGSPAGFPTRHAGRLTSIVYVNPLPRDPLWDRFGTCMTAEAAKHGITVHEVGPPGGNVDVQSMESLVSQAIANHAPAIVTWSEGRAGAFDPLFAQERAQGGLVATLLSADSTRNQNFQVGLDNRDVPRVQIRAIAARPGHHYVGVIGATETGADAVSYLSALRHEAAKHPNVTLETIGFDHNLFTNDLQLASTMLTTHPRINTLLEYNGSPGVATAIKEHHAMGRVILYASSEYVQDMLHYIDQGLMGGVEVDSSCADGRLIVQNLRRLWAGHAVAPNYSDGTRYVSGAEFKRLVAAGQL